MYTLLQELASVDLSGKNTTAEGDLERITLKQGENKRKFNQANESIFVVIRICDSRCTSGRLPSEVSPLYPSLLFQFLILHFEGVRVEGEQGVKPSEAGGTAEKLGYTNLID